MGLAPTIVAELFDVVRGLAAEGVTTVIVEQFAGRHRVRRPRGRDGPGAASALQGRPDEVTDQLASAYLGGSG